MRPLTNINFILAFIIFINLDPQHYTNSNQVIRLILIIIALSLLGSISIKTFNFTEYWEMFQVYQGPPEPIDRLRFSPIYKEINYFGPTLLFLTYITMRFISFKSAIIPLIMLIGTLSRTSIVLGLVSLLSVKKKLNDFMWILVTLLVIVYLSIFVFGTEILERFTGLLDHAQHSGFSGRTVRWGTALSLFYENPYFGIGFYEVMNFGPAFDAAHNTLLEIAAGKGIIGIIIWFTIWVLILMRLKEIPYVLLISMLASSMFISLYDYTEIWRPFAFLIFLKNIDSNVLRS